MIEFEREIAVFIEYESMLHEVLLNVASDEWRENNTILPMREAFVRTYLITHVGHDRLFDQDPEQATTLVLTAAKWCRTFSPDSLTLSQAADYIAATLSSFYTRGAAIKILKDMPKGPIIYRKIFDRFVGIGLDTHVGPERSRDSAKRLYRDWIAHKTRSMVAGSLYKFPASDLKEIFGRPMTSPLSIAAATHYNHPDTVTPLTFGMNGVVYRVNPLASQVEVS